MAMFGDEVEIIRGIQWDWTNFKTTKNFPVSNILLDWVVGQEEALGEINLAANQWIHKLRWMRGEGLLKGDKKVGILGRIKNGIDVAKRFIRGRPKLPPGPYVLLLGDPGTGKTLIGRAMAGKLTDLYEKEDINLLDVLAWPNEQISTEPVITIHPTPEGTKIAAAEKTKAAVRQRWKKTGMAGVLLFVVSLGLFIISLGLTHVFREIFKWFKNPLTMYDGRQVFLRELYNHDIIKYLQYVFVSPFAQQLLIAGATMTIMPFLIFMVGRMFWRTGGGIGGTQQTTAPKVLVDNSKQIAPFIDATGHMGPQLFGSVTWDPLQSGGMGTPEHQRTNAGDVHRAHLGILYIDEIKNLKAHEAITLLTVLEEGELSIAHRAERTVTGTAGLALATDPVPSLCFLLACGNFDSIPQVHPALMDRVVGYGSVVRMHNDMPNTMKNRRKYVQFIAQELQRFRYQPFDRSACIELVTEGRRRSGWRDRLSTKFRPMIDIILKSSQLALNEECSVTSGRHVRKALADHCKTIQRQLLEDQIQRRGLFLEIEPKGIKLGRIYGLAVVRDSQSGASVGAVSRLKAQATEVGGKKEKEGCFEVTGIAKKPRWIDDSIKKVRAVILKKYGVDIEQDYKTFLDFSQSHGIDGPSAGITMTLLMCSLIEGKKLRQNVAVTGEINIEAEDEEPEITAIGGLHEKISAAQTWGFEKVCIPMRNYLHSIDPSDYEVAVVGCETLDDYLKEVMADE